MAKAIVFLLILILWVLLASSTADADTGTTLYLPLWYPNDPAPAGVGSPYSDCEHIRALGATWYQDWSAWPPMCDLGSLPLAMVWSWHGGELPEIAPYAWGVQLANEPNLPQQANMTVAETAELSRLAAHKWPHVSKLSPATYNDLGYLVAVYDEHVRRFGVAPEWDYLAAHCYFDTADGCIRYIESLLEFGQRWEPALQVIVTEWAVLPCSITTMGVRGQPDLARAQAEAGRLRAYFESDERIVAHLWFASEYEGDEWCVWQPHPACDTALMRESRFTEWGRWWTQGH